MFYENKTTSVLVFTKMNSVEINSCRRGRVWFQSGKRVQHGVPDGGTEVQSVPPAALLSTESHYGRC